MALNIAFTWPRTEYGETASLTCPCDAFPELTNDVFATRTCGAAGQWLEANVAACAFPHQGTFCQVCMGWVGKWCVNDCVCVRVCVRACVSMSITKINV